VLVPRENEKDLKEVPEQVKSGLQIVLVGHMDEVLGQALRLPRGTTLFKVPSTVIEYRELVEPKLVDEEPELDRPVGVPGEHPTLGQVPALSRK
jgi:ATP-dependent Lon protease